MMIKTLRKLALMHKLYGIKPERTCGECCNYSSGRYRSKILRKCVRYGFTHSWATDWTKSGMACGMFGVLVPESYKSVIETVKSYRSDGDTPMKGQLELWEADK
jgi:hypothetical protein